MEKDNDFVEQTVTVSLDNENNQLEITEEENISSITDMLEMDESLALSNEEKYTGEKTQIIKKENFKNEKVVPLVYLESTVTDDEGNEETTEYGNLFSIVTQNGSNSNKYLKSICGMAINKSGGDNDATGVVGYAKKMSDAGDGDTCGAGGAAWQFSKNKGLVMGGEFACHQGVEGTTGDFMMRTPNRSLSLHLTTNSNKSPCWGALGIDGHGLSSGHYGFWKGISIQESCWNHNNYDSDENKRNLGKFVKGTTGIDFSTNRILYPENEIEFGNALRHLKRKLPGQAIRHQASYHDFCGNEGEDTKIRFFVDSNLQNVDSQERKNIQLIFADGEVQPETGRHANAQKTTSKLRGSIVSFGDGKGISIRTYHKDTGEVKTVALSPELSTFRPGVTNDISLGTGNYRFKQLYASNGEIDISDIRQKTEVKDVDEALMRAWGKISYKTFKMLSAVEEKGESARIHVGVIAQDIIAAFESENLDAFRYGLVCKDTWEATDPIYEVRTEKVEKIIDEETGEVIQKEGTKEIKEVLEEGKEAGEVLSVRYNECLALEAAYQRWKLKQLEDVLKAKL